MADECGPSEDKVSGAQGNPLWHQACTTLEVFTRELLRDRLQMKHTQESEANVSKVASRVGEH